ncbi:hypothetical protein Tco_0459890 [Tanacetum coccineum]
MFELSTGVVLVKRCGYLPQSCSSRSHINLEPLIEFHRTFMIGMRLCFNRLTSYSSLFKPYIDITLLAINRRLNSALDLNDLLSRFMDNIWASELAIFDLGPADECSTITTIKCLKQCSLNTGGMLCSYPTEYPKLSGVTAKNARIHVNALAINHVPDKLYSWNPEFTL